MAKKSKQTEYINKNRISFELPHEEVRMLKVYEKYDKRNTINIELNASDCTWAHDHVYVIQYLISKLMADCEFNKLSASIIKLEFIKNMFQEMENRMAEFDCFHRLVDLDKDENADKYTIEDPIDSYLNTDPIND
jgi:hypothetical protein